MAFGIKRSSLHTYLQLYVYGRRIGFPFLCEEQKKQFSSPSADASFFSSLSSIPRFPTPEPLLSSPSHGIPVFSQAATKKVRFLTSRPRPRGGFQRFDLRLRRRQAKALAFSPFIRRGVDEGGAKERRAGSGGGESDDSRLFVDRLPSSEAVTGPRRSPREEMMRIGE